jgi:hypothetical protein
LDDRYWLKKITVLRNAMDRDVFTKRAGRDPEMDRAHRSHALNNSRCCRMVCGCLNPLRSIGGGRNASLTTRNSFCSTTCDRLPEQKERVLDPENVTKSVKHILSPILGSLLATDINVGDLSAGASLL